MLKVTLSAFADEYAPNLSSQIIGLNKNGIDHIEVRGVDGKNISTLSDEEIIAAKRQLDDGGITVSAIGSPIGKIGIKDDFETHKKLFDRILTAADILGTKLIRVFSFYIPENESPENYRAEVFKRMEYLLSAADKKGVLLCHENEANIYGDSPERCFDLLQHFGGRLKCVFDPGNFVLGGHKPYPDAYKILKPYIEYFHIKDAKTDGTVTVPGNGDACIAEILSDYAKTTGKVFASLEPHLCFFLGLSFLNAASGTKIKNEFESAEEAFDTSAKSLQKIIINLRGDK